MFQVQWKTITKVRNTRTILNCNLSINTFLWHFTFQFSYLFSLNHLFRKQIKLTCSTPSKTGRQFIGKSCQQFVIPLFCHLYSLYSNKVVRERRRPIDFAETTKKANRAVLELAPYNLHVSLRMRSCKKDAPKDVRHNGWHNGYSIRSPEQQNCESYCLAEETWKSLYRSFRHYCAIIMKIVNFFVSVKMGLSRTQT